MWLLDWISELRILPFSRVSTLTIFNEKNVYFSPSLPAIFTRRRECRLLSSKMACLQTDRRGEHDFHIIFVSKLINEFFNPPKKREKYNVVSGDGKSRELKVITLFCSAKKCVLAAQVHLDQYSWRYTEGLSTGSRQFETFPLSSSVGKSEPKW